MTQSAPPEIDLNPRIFKASSIWESNVWGASVAGIGAGLLFMVLGAILLFESEGPSGRWFGLALVFTATATFLAWFPGNLIAATPVVVELEEGKGLRLIAPLKMLYIPIEEVQEIGDSNRALIFQQGIVVRLNKRHGLLKSFIIHLAFGDEGRQLARAIQREILLRG